MIRIKPGDGVSHILEGEPQGMCDGSSLRAGPLQQD